ncbi:MAG: sugar transferase [Chloroflexi bacterium]|nr:sugar transferase [Chloroflexota bacterium]
MSGGCASLSSIQSSSDTQYRCAHLPLPHRRASFGTQVYERCKRGLDILLSCCLIVLLLPCLVLVAVIIKLDTPGPVLCVQRRVGKGGRVFSFYKFRSMYNNVDHTIAHRSFSREYINGNHAHTPDHRPSDLYKPPSNGSSITPVGRWLRRYSLDELPQLINVLKGDMSLIGPRPSMDYEVEEYADWHYRRLDVLPGITGLAQVNGRSALPFDGIVEYDIQYIGHRSLWLDFRILLKTIPTVLSARGVS